MSKESTSDLLNKAVSSIDKLAGIEDENSWFSKIAANRPSAAIAFCPAKRYELNPSFNEAEKSSSKTVYWV